MGRSLTRPVGDTVRLSAGNGKEHLRDYADSRICSPNVSLKVKLKIKNRRGACGDNCDSNHAA